MEAEGAVGKTADHGIGAEQAEVLAPGRTVPARAATGSEAAYHVVAHFNSADTWPDRFDYSSSFVPRDHGETCFEISICDVQIGMAQTCRRKTDLYLPFAWFRELEFEDLVGSASFPNNGRLGLHEFLHVEVCCTSSSVGQLCTSYTADGNAEIGASRVRISDIPPRPRTS
jgi:hypothetical protein